MQRVADIEEGGEETGALIVEYGPEMI